MSLGVIDMERQVVKMGNSLGSTYPKAVLKHLNVQQGDQVIFQLNDDGTVLLRKQNKVNLPSYIDADLVNTVNDVINEYDEALRELAKR